MKQGQRSREGRRGNVFALRLPPDQRLELEKLCAADNGPRHLGPWLVWRALQGAEPQPRPGNTGARVAGWLADLATFGTRVAELEREERDGEHAAGRWEDDGGTTQPRQLEPVLPAQLYAGAGTTFPGAVVPGLAPSSGNTAPAEHYPPIADRLILDLCAGSGAWSEPYRAAGYPVRRVTLPADDVRTFIAPKGVWGVLAAPPCTEFSLAKNGHPRDFVEGMACVNACLRIVLSAQPRWWALENPVGLLGRWLGEPCDVFEPYDFGEPYSKRTALWGQFERPRRGPRVQAIDGGGPLCVECYPDNPRCCSLAEHRAITPAGFARAFFEANP